MLKSPPTSIGILQLLVLVQQLLSSAGFAFKNISIQLDQVNHTTEPMLVRYYNLRHSNKLFGGVGVSTNKLHLIAWFPTGLGGATPHVLR